MPAQAPKTVTLTAREIEILREVQRRAPWKPLDDLFPAQRQFVQDKHRFKAALCGRRGGKTTSVQLNAIDVCLKKPRANVLYIALTLDSARNLFFAPLKQVCKDKGINVHPNETLLSITFSNGSTIKCRGADRAKEIEKFRGEAFDLVIIDEAASFDTYIDGLIDEVLTPALLDRLGTIVLIGTPSARFSGLFYKVTRPEVDQREPGWHVYSWTSYDNPTIPHAAAELDRIKKARGWNDQTPSFLREYLARWIRSDEDFVYNFDEKRNTYIPEKDTKHGLLPAFDWNFILSVDIGFRDQTAFVVSAFAQNCPDWYIVEAFAKSEMIPSDVAAMMIQLRDRYETHKIVMDCGALGLPIAEEFRARYELQIQPAEKKEKLAAIELMNSDMLNGRVKVPPGCPVVAQWQTLQFDENGLEDPRCKNDMADAALYGWRYARHYLPGDAEKPKETLDSQMAAYWEQKARAQQNNSAREWWEGRSNPFEENANGDSDY